MKGVLAKRVPVWLLLVVATSLALGGTLASLAVWAVRPPAVLEVESESLNTQVINSVSLKEQVVLMSLGIQGIDKKSQHSQFLGVDIPGSDRASFLQYSFTAKLGIEGKDVRISQTGDKKFLISVPRFIFIGRSNEKFELVVEDNGVLSFVTPTIDAVDMATKVLTDDVQATYIASNRELLMTQAQSFYTDIVHSIDPDAVVGFEFAS
ncbi:MAG: hypothetical protein LCH96_03255 [Actinobacteria bacterium]|nr:hypothetical protein [Actinomycetota bacterium]